MGVPVCTFLTTQEQNHTTCAQPFHPLAALRRFSTSFCTCITYQYMRSCFVSYSTQVFRQTKPLVYLLYLFLGRGAWGVRIGCLIGCWSLQGAHVEGPVHPPRSLQAAQLRHEAGSHEQGYGHDPRDGRDGPGEGTMLRCGARLGGRQGIALHCSLVYQWYCIVCFASSA